MQCYDIGLACSQETFVQIGNIFLLCWKVFRAPLSSIQEIFKMYMSWSPGTDSASFSIRQRQLRCWTLWLQGRHKFGTLPRVLHKAGTCALIKGFLGKDKRKGYLGIGSHWNMGWINMADLQYCACPADVTTFPHTLQPSLETNLFHEALAKIA